MTISALRIHVGSSSLSSSNMPEEMYVMHRSAQKISRGTKSRWYNIQLSLAEQEHVLMTGVLDLHLTKSHILGTSKIMIRALEIYGVSRKVLREKLEQRALEGEKQFALVMTSPGVQRDVFDLRHVKAEHMRWILSSAMRFEIEMQSNKIGANDILQNYIVTQFGAERSVLQRLSVERDRMIELLETNDHDKLLLQSVQSKFMSSLNQSGNLVSCISTMLNTTECPIAVDSNWIFNIVSRFCDISKSIDMSSVQSRVAATRLSIQTIHLILISFDETQRQDIMKCIASNIILSDCDVTTWLFSRALNSVVSCLSISSPRTKTTMAKITRSKSRQKQEQSSIAELSSQLQHFAISMIEYVSTLFNDSSSLTKKNVMRSLGSLLQVLSRPSTDHRLVGVLHKHMESWIAIAEKREDSEIMMLILDTVQVLVRRAVYPSTSKHAETFLERLYRSAEQWLNILIHSKPPRVENVLYVNDESSSSTCLNSLFMCVASVHDRKDLLEKPKIRWFSIVFRAMREKIDCEKSGFRVLLRTLCEEDKEEGKRLEDFVYFCRFLTSIFRSKKTYEGLVKTFKDMKAIVLRAKREPMNWQLFCTQSLKRVVEDTTSIQKLTMQTFDDDSVFAYLCDMLFGNNIHVEISETLCEMIALVMSACSSKNCSSSCSVYSAIPSFLRNSCEWIERLFKRYVFRKDVCESTLCCVHDMLCGIWSHSNKSQRSNIVSYLLRIHTPKRVVSLGKRADVILRFCRMISNSGHDDGEKLVLRLIEMLNRGLFELTNHPNDSVYVYSLTYFSSPYSLLTYPLTYPIYPLHADTINSERDSTH